jgi:hypothetical protein
MFSTGDDVANRGVVAALPTSMAYQLIFSSP